MGSEMCIRDSLQPDAVSDLMWNESAGGRKRYDPETDWEALESKLNPDRTHSTTVIDFFEIDS